MRTAAALLFLSLLMQPGPDAGQDVRIFEHPYNWEHPEQVFLTEKDILFNDPFTRLFGSRAFHFLGRLDNGTQYVIDVFRWEYAFLGGWGLSILVVQPDGSTYVSEQKIPDREVMVAEDRFFMQLGASRLEGADGSYRVFISQEEFLCDLRVQNLLPLWHPGDGYVFLTEERDVYLRLGVHCPWALTSGYMVVRGRWISAAGQGYGDRSRHSYPISKINSPILALRSFSPPEISPEERWFLSILQYTTHPSYGSKKIPVLIFARGGRWVFTTKDYTLEFRDFRNDGISTLEFPHIFELNAAARGYRLQGRFTTTDLSHLTDIFAKLPPLFRSVVVLFLKRPVIFRMAGFFQGTVIFPDGSSEQLYLPGLCEYSVFE